MIDNIPRDGYKRPGYKLQAEYVTIHTTANLDSTARNERNWLTNPVNDRQASYHRVVDQTQCIECLPLNEAGFHAGDGRYGDGNRKSVGLEICESGNRELTLLCGAVEAARLLHETGLTPDKLRKHQDWSGKHCPRAILDGHGWEWFVKLTTTCYEMMEV